MAVSSTESQSEGQADRYPLLMEQPANNNRDEHMIDIRIGRSPALEANRDARYDEDDSSYQERPSTSEQTSISLTTSPSPITTNSRDASVPRRNDNYGRRHRSPLNSGLWITVELIVNMSQIIAAIIVLSLSRNEHPQAPLSAWVIGYIAGCFATLPHLYWRYIHRNNQGSEQEPTSLHQGPQNSPSEPNSYTAITIAPEGESRQTPSGVSQFRNNFTSTTTPRFNALVDHFKMALDCFFAIWFVVGNVWIFGGHASSSEAPNLYRLCIVFLTFSCIGYAMPFILCATICCCLPCIISILGFREDLGQTRGATVESINSLPTYKFKLKRGRATGSEVNPDNQGDGGILGAGTANERIISTEDAVCCICLAKFADNDEMRELPCTHFFHKECVDKWLKINALCPLCKFEVGDSIDSPSGQNAARRNDRRVGNGEPTQVTV